MKRYRVLLALDLGDGIVHQHGAVIELEAKVAAEYSHALIACEAEEVAGGGDK